MKILLLFPPFRYQGMYSLPPLGLISLGTIAKAHGHEVKILDAILSLQMGELPLGERLYDEITAKIMDYRPDLLGISCQCTTLPPSINIARRLRERGADPLILLGGHSVSSQAREILQGFPWVDFVLEGEGEFGFLELISSLEGQMPLAEVLGLWWRSTKGVFYNGPRPFIEDLDVLPMPDYGLVPSLEEYQRAYNLDLPIAIIETGRGCPNRCIYCSESVFWRRKVRRYSIPRVIKQLAYLYNNYNARYFLLAHDQFTSDRVYVEEFCKEVTRIGLKDISWYCISRLDTVDENLLNLMAGAGLKTMCYGIDSGSPRTLKFIKKRINKDILFKRVKETTNCGIVPTLSFVIGFPEETEEDIHQSLYLALKCCAYGNVSPLLQMPTVLSGTELFDKYSKHLTREVDTYFSLGLEFQHGKRLQEDEHLIQKYPEIFCSFYNVPCKALSLKDIANIVNHFPYILEIYPKTFLLFSTLLNTYVHTLFFDFLNYVKEHKRSESPELGHKEVLFYSKGFLSPFFVRFPYLRDAYSYETLSAYSRFLKPLSKSKRIVHPVKNKEVLIKAFDFDIPALIIELTEFGRLKPVQRKNYMVFQGKDQRVEITEINEFGFKLLKLCDGRNSVDEITKTLWEDQGRGLSLSGFRDKLLFSLEELKAMGYISWPH